MKKTIISILVLVFVLSFSTPSFALFRGGRDVMKGKVVSINKSKNEITIKDSATNEEKTFIVKREIDPELTVGSPVTLMYQAGTNTAYWANLPRKYKRK